MLINARLSERSAQAIGASRPLSRPLLRALAGIAAQIRRRCGAACATLGARDVVVTGNLKFDVAIPDRATRSRRSCCAKLFGAQRPMLVLASTRDGEEALLLDALARAEATLPRRTLIVIVPRHPQRFDAVAALLDARRIPFARRSANAPGARRRARRARRFARRDVRVLRGGRRRVRRRQPAAARRAEPDRADRRRRPDADRPAHVQFRGGERAAIAAGAALRVRDADGRIRRRRPAARAMRRARERMRDARAGVHGRASRRDRPAVELARAADRAIVSRAAAD